ncbi:MAG: saccharopine dehydrogenase C-terminal domain-containing protein [Bacteroidota bacterium]|nr:saccharopine dehydrogenase C-terminal domain-containing protein [Bacteroidota bacterium]MDP3144967.1 saccharopine dehydrogenase C-terminal domain-containing protein [Bacteroidota bacterium]
MTKILILGAGRSTVSLIDYLLKNSTTYSWKITVSDVDIKLAQEKVASHPNGTAISFDIKNDEKRRLIIHEHDFIISMLPAFMHGDVARDCVEFGKNMATASYVSGDMKALDNEAKRKNIILLNECGLDPGIDHASAMKLIDEIKHQGGEINSFKSYTGGLVAPESNDNPWGYKFSWNPRNVILAGQGTAQYLHEGELKFIPYNRLFTQHDVIEMDGYGKFDAYANRDSISYIDAYDLRNIKTMVRGTLRQDGYCKGWNVFVKLGLTDDSSIISHANKLTYTSLLASFLPPSNGNLRDRLKSFMGAAWDEQVEKQLDYLELFSDKKIELQEGTPAQLLQALLEEKWKLQETDKDMIVMQHQFEYTLANKTKQKLNSSLVVIGKDQNHTAMALTVGLPLAITVKNFLTKQFNLNGIQIPTKKEIYIPLLKELEEHKIIFSEKII